MELKITIAFDERTHETLGRLADALSKEMTVTVAQPESTQNDTHGNAQKPPVNTQKAKAEQEPAKTANAAQSEENASQTATRAETPVLTETAEPKKAEKPLTQEELRGIAADVRTKTGTADGIKQVLAKYGAKKLSEVPEDKYADFAHDLEELL